jgi:hypothetical protein
VQAWKTPLQELYALGLFHLDSRLSQRMPPEPPFRYNLAVALFSIDRIEEAADHLELAMAEGVEPPHQLVTDMEARSREQALADGSSPTSGLRTE